MRAVSEPTIWLGFGLIIALLTVGILYLMFPRSECDDLAEASADEIQAAVLCAAGKGPQGCSNTAVVRFCQEETPTFSFNEVSRILGYGVPQYMIYYKEFPLKEGTEDISEEMRKTINNLIENPAETLKDVVSDLFLDFLAGGTTRLLVKWNEAYPFERSLSGQRPWDIRPTTTEFKHFYKFKYLEEACTEESGFCFGIRGREKIVSVEGVEKEVKIERIGTLGISETNPTFYLVAPCYAKVTFSKDGDGNIIGDVEKAKLDASNYCYADEGTVALVREAYAAEIYCVVGETALAYLTGGTGTAAVKAVIWSITKTVGKKIIGMDECRGLAMLIESRMWPPSPFKPLTQDKVKGKFKSTFNANELFRDCCYKFSYEEEKDTEKIDCEEVYDKYLARKVKPDIRDLSLKSLGDYLNYDTASLGGRCDSITGGYMAKEQACTESPCPNEIVYDFSEAKTPVYASFYIKTNGDEECETTATANISDDSTNWKPLWGKKAKFYDGKHFSIPTRESFQYLRISDKDGNCGLNYTSVVLNSTTQPIIRAETNKKYDDLEANAYNFFKSPVSASAKALCTGLEGVQPVGACSSVFRQETGDKYSAESNTGEFEIKKDDIIGIYATKSSSIIFKWYYGHDI